MSKIDYDSKAAEIDLITNVSTPTIPVDAMLQEAENLLVWCQPDKAILVQSGLDWTLVTDLHIRASALRYVQSLWQQQYLSIEDAQRQWKEKSPAAYALRDELIHHFRHGFRKFPDLYSTINRIADGSGHADMIQDLSDLALLGKANLAPLTAIGMDPLLLDAAERNADEMAVLLAQTNGERMSNNELKITRDKAYTFLKQAVDEIRHHGQYVFWRNDDRVKGYVSKYHKHRNQKSKPKDDPE